MALLTCADLGKSFTSRPLFRGISLSISEGERIGMLGPNGAGKSTLLKIFAGLESEDEGTISRPRGLAMAYLPQTESFPAEMTVGEVLSAALAPQNMPAEQIQRRVGEINSVLGFEDLQQRTDKLSGGWRKRLAIGTKIIGQPELLLLDEPTNHLDLEGIEWLESFLASVECSVVMVSHDRTLLERSTTRIVEINRVYPQGYFSVDGNYSRFLEKRAEYLESLASYEESLRNKVRREIEWLRRGAKARTTKAKGRIQQAGKMITELKEYESRSSSQGTAGIDFISSGRKTKRLIELEKVSKAYGDKILFKDVNIVLSPGVRLGVVGANGSGKSTLLQILGRKLLPDSGNIRFAPAVKIVSFEQDRSSLDLNISLKRAISPDGDSIVFQDRALHVAAWARRFLFRPEQLEMPVRSLSGGEQARLLIAKLMLEPADVLLLDEPTNDLDIDTLQVLEESLEEFPGAVALVTHDRFMLDRVSNVILGLPGGGAAEIFAEYAQWEDFLTEAKKEKKIKKAPAATAAKEKNRLSYNELRELNKIEKQIQQLEASIKKLKEELASPEYAADVEGLGKLYNALQEQEAQLETLMGRWAELQS